MDFIIYDFELRKFNWVFRVFKNKLIFFKSQYQKSRTKKSLSFLTTVDKYPCFTWQFAQNNSLALISDHSFNFNKLSTFFEREDDSAVQHRKLDATRPLERRRHAAPARCLVRRNGFGAAARREGRVRARGSSMCRSLVLMMEVT